jgi:hypothetical protein
MQPLLEGSRSQDMLTNCGLLWCPNDDIDDADIFGFIMPPITCLLRPFTAGREALGGARSFSFFALIERAHSGLKEIYHISLKQHEKDPT